MEEGGAGRDTGGVVSPGFFFPSLSDSFCSFVRRFRGFLVLGSGKTDSTMSSSSLSLFVSDLATGVAEARGRGLVEGVDL